MSELALSNPNASAWYEIGVKNPRVLLVRIHRQAFAFVQSVTIGSTPIAQLYESNFNLGGFTEPFSKSWGFHDCLSLSEESAKPDWTIFECPLPVLYKEEDGDADRLSLWSMRATLSILFNLLWLFEGDTQCEDKQLMIFEHLCVEADMHGGSFSVKLTNAMCDWISAQGEQGRLLDVERLMQEVDAHMCRPQKPLAFPELEFQARYRKSGYLNLSVPGNACGLDPESYSRIEDEGYALLPHNVDSGIQQITLLMALAGLHDLARQQRYDTSE